MSSTKNLKDKTVIRTEENHFHFSVGRIQKHAANEFFSHPKPSLLLLVVLGDSGKPLNPAPQRRSVWRTIQKHIFKVNQCVKININVITIFFLTLLEVDRVRKREYSLHRADVGEKRATLSNGIFSQQEKLCLACVKRSR